MKGKGSIAVNISAVLAILGSLLTLAFAALFAALPAISPSIQSQELPDSGAFYIVAASVALAGIWGLVTGIGLLRRKLWSRVSVLIFSTLAVLLCSAMVVILFLFVPPLPPDQQGTWKLVRLALLAVYGIPLAVCASWVLLFTRPQVREQFGTPAVWGGKRPAGILLVGWIFILLSFSAPVSAYYQIPLQITGIILKGKAAAFGTLLLGAVIAYAGVGLLKFRSNAHLWAIGYLGFGIVDILVNVLVPGMWENMQAAMFESPFFENVPKPATAYSHWFTLPSFMLFGAGILYLWKHRGLFRPGPPPPESLITAQEV